MSSMRLIVAGAGGLMGRTLIHAIAATEGVTLAGAVDAAGSAVIGRDAGELAGLGTSNVVVGTDVAPLLATADGLIDFTVPAATAAFAELTARAGRVHIIGTTGLSPEDEALIAAADHCSSDMSPRPLSQKSRLRASNASGHNSGILAASTSNNSARCPGFSSVRAAFAAVASNSTGRLRTFLRR